MLNYLKVATPAIAISAILSLSFDATAFANTPAHHAVSASPRYISSCTGFVHRGYPSSNSAYCYGGDGATFRAWIYCHMDDGEYQYHYGTWELASDNVRSVAQCGQNGVWAGDGINQHP